MKTGYSIVIGAAVLSATTLWAAAEPQAVTNMGNVRGGDVKAAHVIISKKCTTCHSGKVIDAALSANKDMDRIQLEMEKRGAALSAGEREVLGIYWKQQNPLKKKK